MVQVVKKKKGRPSKEDLAQRSNGSPAKKESDVRRSFRPRNVRYSIGYEDYIDEDDEEEEEAKPGDKKVKLVMKLGQGRERAELATGRNPNGAPGVGESASDQEDSDRKILKRRRIQEEENYENRDEDEEDNDYEGRGRRRKVGSKGSDSVPGTPSDHFPCSALLPDKKKLELILDKLQKKDIYGVYAEPVDPEELPDYHDIIEQPMDFATVRKKLANGSYSTLEQFESNVFLICSNAMQYNPPETVYYKQARTIQEMAKKKFERLRRVDSERSEKEPKLEQETKIDFLIKKQTNNPLCRTVQETIGSDFSSVVNLATTGDVQNSSNPTQGGGCMRPSNIDRLVDYNSSLLINTNHERPELFPGKGVLSRLGRKTSFEDDRRATYDISHQPVFRSESVFATFEGEVRQLVAVGLHAEYSYARSLARFAATLGPVAWKIASQRIELAIPAGCKFGRGWIGENEPLPTPVLVLKNHNQKEADLLTDLEKDYKALAGPFPAKVHPIRRPSSEAGNSSFGHVRGPTSDRNPYLSGSAEAQPSTPADAIYQQQHKRPSSNLGAENRLKKKAELFSLTSSKQTNAYAEKHFPSNFSDTVASRSRDTASVNMNFLQSTSCKLLDANGVTGGLPNGKIPSNCLDNQKNPPSPVEAPPFLSPLPSARKDGLYNAAAAAAAHAWMPVGAGGFNFKQAPDNCRTPKNQIPSDSPLQFLPQQIHVGNEAQINKSIVSPHFAPADLSRLQMSSQRQCQSQYKQPLQKQDMQPPDLNIGFQSPMSSMKQSSGVLVDSQQPDLALQL